MLAPRPVPYVSVAETAQLRLADDQPIDLMAFAPLVRSIACRIYASIPPYASVDLNDLLQSGHLGLVHAAKAFQKGRHVPFSVYARFRIRGEILDALRRLDFASRGLRRTEKLLRSLPDPPGRPSPVRCVRRLPSIAITSLEDRWAETVNWRNPSPGPDKIHSVTETRTHLEEALRSLAPRSQELMRAYYQGGLTMRQIGERFRIKESRVSQLHRGALNAMALHLRAAGIQSAREIWEMQS